MNATGLWVTTLRRKLPQSLRARPASFSSEVTEWLHETVRMLLSSSVSLVHTGPTPVLQGAYTSADLGMHLASASAQTGISPLSSIPLEIASEHGLVATFSTHVLAECFPIGALRDSWTWRDLLKNGSNVSAELKLCICVTLTALAAWILRSGQIPP